MAAPVIILNNGQKFPNLGLGTWQSAPGEVEKAVKHAIDVGYRHFDCALLYENEPEIGKALREKIAEGAVKREDLFVVTKLWNTFHERELVVPTCKKSLESFGLDYIDLYLIHWPVAQKMGTIRSCSPFLNATPMDYDYVDTWKGMEDCVKLGLTKGIGLSNFNSKQIERVLNAATIKPVVNQVEAHPLLNQKKLIKFCQDRNIVLTAYSPLGSPARPWKTPEDPIMPMENPDIACIGKKYGKTTSQIILRYLIEIGTVPIPKSSNKDRIKQNIDIFDFKLTPEEISFIDTFNCNYRFVPFLEIKDHKDYPFTNLVEF